MDKINTGLGTIIRRMNFRNPIFQDGLNCTVRCGCKWANLRIGEKIILSRGQEAVVEKIIVCRFKDLSEADISVEHDPNCRSKVGLFNYLAGIYPEFARDKENSVVTVVYFRILT